MSQERLKSLYHERGVAIAAAQAVHSRSIDEKRRMTAEEQAQFDALMDESDKVADEARRLERLMETQRQMETLREPVIGREATTGETRVAATYTSRGRTLELGNVPVTSPETRSGMRQFVRAGLLGMSDGEKRALQADADVQGGFIRPDQEFVARLIQKVDDQVFMRRNGTVIPMTSAESLGVPSLDADPDDADWTSELETGNEDSAMAFGKRELRPHPIAKLLKVSNKLLRSSAIDIEGLVRDRLAYKVALPQEKGYLTGHGVNQPLGVFTASADGVPTSRDVQTGSATDFTADGLILAKYTLKPQYWPKARWLLHRDGVRRIRQLKGSDNNYLWQPGLSGGQPDQILNSPYDVSEFAPNTFTTGLYVGMYADFSFYWIVEAMTFQLQRLNELYARTNQTGFIVRAESDGQPVLDEAFVRLKTN